MNAPRRDLLFAFGLIAFFVAAVWATVFVTSRTVNHLLLEDAKAEGEDWARYLAANVTDLSAIVAGAPPSPESLRFFEHAQQVGDVFLYKMFDAEGGLRLASDHLEDVGESAASIPVHNPEAAEVVLEGKIQVEAEEGTSPDRPAFYAEAYVPVEVDGRIIGIVEAYVDQSEKRANFQHGIVAAGLALATIIAIACGVPALGFYWRTRQKRASDTRAAFLADHDPLTGLLNRTRFLRDLDQALVMRSPVAVHCIDIDRFKDVNETLGHAAGDAILKETARRLQALSGPRHLLARLGADEFGVAQVAPDDRQVEAFARRLSATLAEPFHLMDQDIAGTASIGTALGPAHGTRAEALMKSAELALSNSKSEGAGCLSRFRPEMDVELQARRDLERLLRRAVASNGFELHFQPIQRASDSALTGFEALLRLPAKGGLIPPDIFIPVAERMGLITAIGAWVIRRACMIAATWPGRLAVSVNLSPVQFEDGKIAETVRAALAEADLPAERLELEITEGLLLSDTDWVMRQLGELKTLGVRIAMDDFGTGYSSLNYLWKFPFDKLKIDQSFIRGLRQGDEHLTSVIRTVVALGRSLGMIITAEGVETEDQAAFLRAVGCDELQGFHVGRPVPVERLPAIILGDFRDAMHAESSAAAPKMAAAAG